MEFQNSQERFRKLLLGGVIVAFLALSLLYSVSIPTFESQDEEHHFAFINHFANRMELPDFRKIEDLNSAGCQANQTPLYYFFQGLLLRAAGQRQVTVSLQENPFRSAGTPALYLHNQPGEHFPYSGAYRVIHLLRFTNIAAGILILLIIHKSARLMLFENGNFPVIAAAFTALIPQFTYICATLNNDVFCILFSSIAFFFLMKFLLAANDSVKYPIYMSVALGLAILSKQMALSLVVPFYLAVLIKGSNRERMHNLIAVTLVLAGVVGWYYARNWLLFRDPFAIKVQMEVLAPNLVQKKSVLQMSSYLSNYFARSFLNSFWGSFGYLTVQMHWMTYLFYNVLTGVGLFAFATGMVDANFRNRFSRRHLFILFLFVIACLLLLAEILSFNMSFSQPQGRYGFNALLCLAVFWGLGMDRVITGKQVHRNLVCFSLVALLALVNLHVVTGTIRKAFPPLPGHIDDVQREADGNLGELTNKTLMGQTFHCDADGLDSIAVLLTTFGRYNNCHVVFHLRNLADPAVDVASQRVPALKLQNDTFHFFRFPPLKNSGGQNYLFYLESPDAKAGDAVSCYYTQKDSYPAGHAILNNRILRGDLVFISGCD